MDYSERIERLNNHIQEHPKDYQAVIAMLKTRSDAYEHTAYVRRIERLQRVAEIRKRRKGNTYGS